MRSSFYERYCYLILGAFVCLVPLVLWGAWQAMSTSANDVRTWLPQGLPEAQEYAAFQRYFGSEEFVAVSWDGCTLEDPRVGQLADRLRRRAVTPGDHDNTMSSSTVASGSQSTTLPEQPLVENVTTGSDVVHDLTHPPINLSHNTAVDRLCGLMIGPDRQQTCVLVRPTELGKQDPAALLNMVRDEAVRAGIASESLRMGGPLVISASIDEAATSSLAIPGPLSIFAAVFFSWFCFRSLRITVPVIVIGAFSAVAALALVWYTGAKMNAVLLSMPPLVYVATTSGAIHFTNYLRATTSEQGYAGATSRAAMHARLPLVLATSTTVMGLLTLSMSELLPIRAFGIYSAAGVAASLVWLLIVLPALFEVWPIRSAHTGGAVCTPAARIVPSSRTCSRFRVTMDAWAWGERITQNSIAVTISCLLVAVLCGVGLSRIKTTVSAEGFFPDDARLPRASRWMESHLGGMVPMEVIIRFPADCNLDMLERIDLIDRVRKNVAKLEHVSATLSAATFCRDLPKSVTRRRGVWRSTVVRQLERNRPQIEKAGFLASDGGVELWRVSLRTHSFHNVDQRYFIDMVRAHVEPVLAEQRERSNVAIAASYTGMVPLIERSQQSLLEGLGLGLLTDLIVIVATMVFVMRHWAPGLMMLAACALPILVVVGGMGWLNIPLDIGTVLAPSVALGVSVDDVLHFLLWFRRGVEQGLDRRQSIRLAYGNCARAMFQSWGVIGLGLGIFAWSDFTPTHRFGLLMLLLVSISLVSNLVLLPALLASRMPGPNVSDIGKSGMRLANRPKATGAPYPPPRIIRREPLEGPEGSVTV